MTDDFEILLDRKALCGECPLWNDVAGRLHWVDILRREIHTFDPMTGEDTVVLADRPVGAVALAGGGELIAAAGLGFGLLDPSTGALRALGEVGKGDRMNDGACDPRGRFLAGTLTYQRTPGAGALYRLDRAGPTLVVDDLTLSNGLGWSPDGETMYLIDTGSRTLWAYDYRLNDGVALAPRPLVVMDESEGNPDGLAVDSTGAMWVAMHWTGRIHRYLPDGTLDHVLAGPTKRITSLAFGGAGLADLYVTAACFAYGEQQLVEDPGAGGLFRFRPGVTGLPGTPWAGI
jgi:sugar lactone lactonase YvrE